MKKVRLITALILLGTACVVATPSTGSSGPIGDIPPTCDCVNSGWLGKYEYYPDLGFYCMVQICEVEGQLKHNAGP